MSFADATIARLPRGLRPFAERHHELIKFALVGATTFIIDSAIFYTLKLTVLEPKPVTAKIIAGIVAVIASYILNREWSFKDRGGRERHHEALLFFGVSGVGVLLAMAPLYFSSYVLGLRVPEVSLTVENIADFISAYVIGNLLQMAFRFWAFRRWVFPDEFARNPEKALESTLTAGGIAEAFEDHAETGRNGHAAEGGHLTHAADGGHLGKSVGLAQNGVHNGSVTPLHRTVPGPDQLGDSSASRVSKTS